MMTDALTLGAPRTRGLRAGPERPSLILPAVWNPVQFLTLPELARYVQRRREGRGIVLRFVNATYRGSDTFPAFAISWERDGDEAYAFTAAIQTDRRETLEAALAAANLDVPEPA